jgi:dihydroxyacetone kinase-like protein
VPIETVMTSALVATWMTEAAASIREHADHLTQLDAAIGDGDHGTNMRRGFDAVEQAVAEAGDEPPGKQLTLAGRTLVSTVGGASGPLWGSALRRAGRALGDAPDVDSPALVAALEAAVAAVQELGAAQPGDKTMLDALMPATDALGAALRDGAGLPEALRAAPDAAGEGAAATIPMQARKGRASYLGERSIGHEDPGASSAALIVAALARAAARAG